jgi:hypothetical protein
LSSALPQTGELDPRKIGTWFKIFNLECFPTTTRLSVTWPIYGYPWREERRRSRGESKRGNEESKRVVRRKKEEEKRGEEADIFIANWIDVNSIDEDPHGGVVSPGQGKVIKSFILKSHLQVAKDAIGLQLDQ